MGVQESLVATLKGITGFGEIVQEASSVDPAAALTAANEQLSKMFRLAAMVECAYLIASADGNASAEELSHIKKNMNTLTEGAVSEALVDGFLAKAAEKATAEGRDARIKNLATALVAPGDREAAFLVGANAAWTGGGVGTQEGLCMQAIARAFGWEISHMHKLLGKARG